MVFQTSFVIPVSKQILLSVKPASESTAATAAQCGRAPAFLPMICCCMIEYRFKFLFLKPPDPRSNSGLFHLFVLLRYYSTYSFEYLPETAPIRIFSIAASTFNSIFCFTTICGTVQLNGSIGEKLVSQPWIGYKSLETKSCTEGYKVIRNLVASYSTIVLRQLSRLVFKN